VEDPRVSHTQSKGLDERHFLRFGEIVQLFAEHELLLGRTVAHVLGTQAAPVLLLMQAMSFEEKRKALLDLMRHREIPLDHFDAVSSFFGFLLPFLPLRHNIVHATWSIASSDDMLQPAWILKLPPRVKPVIAKADEGQNSFVEDPEEKMGYSLAELSEIAAQLRSNLAALADYLVEIGWVTR
jgi:hypothetical protein